MTLVVSLGVQPVTVPTVVGEAQATAAASIVAAGLVVGTVTTAYDANVPAGSVISQNPSGGTSALPGTAVTLVVSLGVQPVTVPTVVGEAQATAAASIVAAGLVVGTVTTAYDANVPAGSVISQNPSGGTSALPGTAVTLVVSLGVQPVTVPTVVGEAQATAAASIVAAGLVVGTVTTAYDANVPAGSVISQNPSGGTSALPGTAVTLVVSLGVQPVTVPTVVGEAQATAAASIVAAGLVVGTVTTAYDANVPAGSVISQNPSGGTSALPGTAVTLVVSLGVQPVTVPNVVGEAQATAAASIVAAGLVVGTVTTAYDANVPAGSVISQNPSGGTSALPGTAVTLVVSLGVQPVTVPNVVGEAQATAAASIVAAGLVVGTVTTAYDANVPAGSVISQNPSGGTSALPGTAVTLVVSLGVQPVPVPNVVGEAQATAAASIVAAGLVVGTVTTAYDANVPAGSVISQNPSGGTSALPGTAVTLVVSLGVQPVTVPNVVGEAQATAAASIVAAGLVVGTVTTAYDANVPAGSVISQNPSGGTSALPGTAVTLVVSLGVQPVPVPNVVGEAQATAAASIVAAGLVVGTVTTAYDANVPAGSVISQNPSGGTSALPGTAVTLVVSLGVQPVPVPNVVGEAQATAAASIVAAGLVVGTVTTAYDANVPAGSVISQNPSGGTSALPGTAVTLVVSLGVQPVPVPNVVGEAQATAAASIVAAGLVVGTVTTAYDANVPAGSVISQNPSGGTSALPGTAVTLVVSLGVQPVPVPNVVGEAQATAAASIVAAGLVVGTVTTAYDANVPAGSVISQNPSGGTSALPGTAVTLVVSLGVQPVPVPNVVGEAQATAAASIVAAGLVVGTVTTAYDANVPAGSVISQNPSGGTSALPGTAVTLVVSLGVQPVPVPNVVGEAQATAAASIVAAGLVVGTVTTAYDANVPAGSVISQNPSGGTSALPGTAVTLVVSLGVQPVPVPNVVGEAQATAAASIVAAGLVVGTVTTAYDANVPAGSVISQNPSGGTSALPGTAVTLVVSLGVQPVPVPNVVGEAQATAAASIVAAGLVVGTVTTAYDANVPAGSVISQNPSGGTSALPGTAVTLVVSLGVQPVPVPNVVGEAQATAAASIVAAGLVVGTVTTAYDANVPAGSVISQNPSGGTSALPGTAVTLVVSLGVQPVPVPNVVGEAQATAAASIVAAGLVVGTVTTAYDANVPAGSVISQNPSGGTSALPGTAVTLVVSLGVQPVPVPNVVGEAQATAAASIVAAGLVVGTVTTAYDANVPAGSVISQNPSGGTSALPGTAVTLVVSLGVQPVPVPNVVGEAQATAAASIVAAGLVVGTVTTAYDANVPAGSVISQNPSGGTSALPGTAVTLVVSLGVQPVPVPNVVGEAQATAAASIVAAGLVVGTVTTAYDANVPAGSVISQNPSGGTSALPGTAVTLVVSLGVQPVPVPNVVGEAQATAAASIVAAGLVVGTVTTAYDANVPAGSVISQNPSGGTSALPGTAVTLVVSLGVQPVPVPNVVGEAQATAAASIVAAGLVVGTVTTAYDANVPAGSVISQNPSGGTSALPGTAVTLVVSLGVQPVPVPNVVGEAQATAAASIVAAGLVVGTVTTAYDANVPAGSVISQNPSGGTSALPGTAVTLVVSLGVQPGGGNDTTSNLVSHWRLDDGAGLTAQDSTGGSPGALQNGPLWVPGKLGSALSFDGADDLVDLGILDIAGSALTIAAWIKADSFATDDGRILSRTTGGAEQDHYFMLSTINNGGMKLRFRLKTGTTTTTLLASSGTLAVGQWIHVAAVYDGSAMILYQDGVEVGRRAKTGALATSATTRAAIGRNPQPYAPFDGTIDDVRVYARALSPAAIGALIALASPDPTDTTPPTVAITAPASGSTVSGTVTVSANATDSGGIAGVQFTLDGVNLGAEDLTAPYSVAWNTSTVAAGSHTLAAQARDLAGNLASTAITVTVAAATDTTPPTVAITAPASGSTVSGTVTVSANATDSGGIAGVQFTLDGVNLGAEDLTAPYSVAWNTSTVAAGSHTLAAQARDLAGNLASTAITVTVTIPPGGGDDTTSNLVSHWRLDDGAGLTAQDSTGGSPGALQNGPLWVPGKLGSALSFDGADDLVDLGILDIAGSALTIAAWIKADSFATDDGRILSRTTGGAEQDHYFMLSTINNGGMKLRFRLKTGTTTTTLLASSGTLAVGQWIHVAAVYDGSAMILYQDGVEVGRRAKTGALATSATTRAAIGRNPQPYAPFDGTIDDVRVYQRALSASDVQALAGMN